MIRQFGARLLAAVGVLVCLAFGSAASADTTVFIGGQCGLGGNNSSIILKHSGTGCPSAGSWSADTLAVGTDGAICYTAAGGSPGTWAEVGGGGGAEALDDLSDVTIASGSSGEVIKWGGSGWVDGTIDGSDVGLADSPGSDGNYYLDRASSANSWAALADVAVSGSAADLVATGVTDGYVLTADGSNGVAWEAASGGGPTITVYEVYTASSQTFSTSSETLLSGVEVTVPAAKIYRGVRFVVHSSFEVTNYGGSTSNGYGKIKAAQSSTQVGNFGYIDIDTIGGTTGGSGPYFVGEGFIAVDGASGKMGSSYIDGWTPATGSYITSIDTTADMTVGLYGATFASSFELTNTALQVTVIEP